MIRTIMHLTPAVRAVLQHAPTNRLLRRLQRRRAPASAVAAIMVGVAYLFAAVASTVLLDRGGPGWLNLLVLLFVYNSGKLALHGLAMLVSPARQRPGRLRPSHLARSPTEEPDGGFARQR